VSKSIAGPDTPVPSLTFRHFLSERCLRLFQPNRVVVDPGIAPWRFKVSRLGFTRVPCKS
jgi:hypothetical protein